MSRPILRALDALNDRLVSADAIGQALDLAAGDHPAPWVQVYRSQLEAIREASEALETLLRGHGGCGPHGDKVPACPGLVRGLDSVSLGSPSCPEKRSSMASE